MLVTEKFVPKETCIDMEEAGVLARSPIVPELFQELLETAEKELIATTSISTALFKSALPDFILCYEQHLARLTNLTILQRFSSFHLALNPLWRPRKAVPGKAATGSSRTILDAYINWEETLKLLSTEGPYPELGRLVALTKKNWLENTRIMLERIALHHEEIARLMGITTTALGNLKSAKFGISDAHNNGQTAAILSFGDRKIVYKPRSLDGEEGWNAIVNEVLNTRMKKAVLVPKIIKGDGYGFMEFIGSEDCSHTDEIQLCYERYGAILAIAHVIGTCDLHHENIIVSGAHPVVIDAEPLFRARLGISQSGEDRLKFERNLSLEGLDVKESVLELGILPLVMKSPLKNEENEDIQAEHEIGALVPYGLESFYDMLPCAKDSDDLQIRPIKVKASSFPNLPYLNGTVQLPKDYLDEIINGFTATYEYLEQHKDDFLSDDGFLKNFETAKIRMLARPTMDYTNILSRSLSPEVLNDYEARKELIKTDLEITSCQRMDTIDGLLETELNSILGGDIPLFELPSNVLQYKASALLSTPLDCAKSRWQAMDSFDKMLQVTSIKERLLQREKNVIANKPTTFQSGDLLQHGLEIAASLYDAAISKNKAPHWVYTSYAPGFAATMAHIDRESLYEGAAGTALVLAEAGRLGGQREWQQLAVNVFDPLLNGEKPVAVHRGAGIARGLGGLLYSMTRIAQSADSDQLLNTATTIATQYAPEINEKEVLNEVLYGRAGLLLSLLSLYKVNPNARLLAIIDDIAITLKRNVISNSEEAYWQVPNGKPLPHVSHGNSGIAMALARWAALRGDDAAAQIVLKAMQFDDNFWNEKEKGWDDARFLHLDHDKKTNWSWCNGRSGAILSRLSISQALGIPFESNAMISDSIQAEKTDVLEDVSSGLCCGTAGVIDAMLEVKHHCCNHHHIDATLEHAVKAIATKSPCSHYSTLTSSLFTGSSSLAFSLMRAAKPDAVKSVLFFE